MSEQAKRRQLAALSEKVLTEDLDLAISVMMDFAARWLNERNKKGAA